MFESLLEAFIGRNMPVKDNTGRQKNFEMSDDVPQSLLQADYQQLSSFLSEVKKSTDSRKERAEEMDQMMFDSIISSALDLVAGDATQEDPIRNRIMWITSEDPECTTYLTKFIDNIKLESKLHMYAYNIAAYGDLYLKTYYSDYLDGSEHPFIRGRNGYIFEKVDKPYHVAELQQFDVSVGFAELNDDEQVYQITSPHDYIHFINDQLGKRYKINIDKKDQSGQTISTDQYKVRYGTGIFEAARQAWIMLDLIESLLIYVRFGKSAFYRMIKIEVGGASRNEIMRILRETKEVFNHQDNLDLSNGSYRGIRKPIPHGENIYIPTKQGKGDVQVETVGGDVDIKDVVDLDYWRDKLFASLKIPKAYLGFEETQPGGLGNMSLTRQDIRYARSVKLVQKVLKNGLKQMIDYHLKATNHRAWLGKYEINLTKIMSAEASDIQEDLNSRIQLADALNNLLQSLDVDKQELASVIIKNILSLDDRFASLYDDNGDIKTSHDSSDDLDYDTDTDRSSSDDDSLEGSNDFSAFGGDNNGSDT